ncbi:MAG: anti-sigma factor [Armatimonadetes bacterium]|nr:anti-sigma factor [Anaerolineae bacterium]
MMTELSHYPENNVDCETLRDLLPAYGLGLADAQESALVQRLLPACAQEAAELPQYQALASRLAASVPQLEPPAHLLASVLQAATVDDITPMTRLPRPIMRRRLPVWGISAAAAVLLLVLLNVWTLTRTTALSETVSAQTTMLTLFANDDVLTFNMSDKSVAPSPARARLLCNPDERVVVILAENFPPDAYGYPIWLWRNGERFEGGRLQVDADGRGTVVFQAPRAMRAFSYAAIEIAAAPTSGNTEPTIIHAALYSTTPSPEG